jgi:hypothetical protein
VRLTGIGDADHEPRQDDKQFAFHIRRTHGETDKIRVFRLECRKKSGKTAGFGHDYHRESNERENHDDRLQVVGPRYRSETVEYDTGNCDDNAFPAATNCAETYVIRKITANSAASDDASFDRAVLPVAQKINSGMVTAPIVKLFARSFGARTYQLSV